jgi:hypothetical protein
MGKELSEEVTVVWVGPEHPHAQQNGAGFYEVLSDDPNDQQNPKFGKEVVWEPHEEQTNNNPNEVQGRFVYKDDE